MMYLHTPFFVFAFVSSPVWLLLLGYILGRKNWASAVRRRFSVAFIFYSVVLFVTFAIALGQGTRDIIANWNSLFTSVYAVLYWLILLTSPWIFFLYIHNEKDHDEIEHGQLMAGTIITALLLTLGVVIGICLYSAISSAIIAIPAIISNIIV